MNLCVICYWFLIKRIIGNECVATWSIFSNKQASFVLHKQRCVDRWEIIIPLFRLVAQDEMKISEKGSRKHPTWRELLHFMSNLWRQNLFIYLMSKNRRRKTIKLRARLLSRGRYFIENHRFVFTFVLKAFNHVDVYRSRFICVTTEVMKISSNGLAWSTDAVFICN